MIGLPAGTQIWIVAGVTEMRCGFQRLAGKVETALQESFNVIKLLWATGDGLCLLSKKLERGRFVWPHADSCKVHLTPAQLSMLLEGVNWNQPERTSPPLSVLYTSVATRKLRACPATRSRHQNSSHV